MHRLPAGSPHPVGIYGVKDLGFTYTPCANPALRVSERRASDRILQWLLTLGINNPADRKRRALQHHPDPHDSEVQEVRQEPNLHRARFWTQRDSGHTRDCRGIPLIIGQMFRGIETSLVPKCTKSPKPLPSTRATVVGGLRA